jgi:hypothetical protein
VHATPEQPGPPDAGQESRPKRNVRVLYDRDHITVTDRWIEVWGMRYPLAELHHVRILRARPGSLTASWVLIAIGIAIARLWDRLGSQGWVGAVAVLTALGLVALLEVRRRRRSHLMIAQYLGSTLVVLSDENGSRFNRVTRAVGRAQDAINGAAG